MKPGFVIIVIIGIVLAWAFLSVTGSSFSAFGDRDRESRENRASVSRGQSARPDASETIVANANESSFVELVSLRKARATRDEPQEEYLEVRADKDNTRSINITGWKLVSTQHGRNVSIGTVQNVPIERGYNPEDDPVLLEPGDSAYIISSASPINTSFRTNKCIGYLEEKKDFAPRLSRNCPDAEDGDLDAHGIDSTPRENSSDEECIDALKRIGRCENPGKPDEDLNRDCREYIDELDYNFCAGMHVRDDDFMGDEWYVYVGRRFTDLWHDESDRIELRDSSGRVVDVVEY